MIFDKNKLIISGLAIALFVVFVWFVVIDNYIIPIQQQQLNNAYQIGYNKGTEDFVLELFQETSTCQTPTTIWIGNNTKELIDVACLQIIPGDNSKEVMRP